MKTGEIYLFDNSAGYQNSIVIHRKVICFDDFEVFADSKRLDDSKWDLDLTKTKTAIFVRSSKHNFEKWATKIDYIEYSADRLAVIKPELPLRLGRLSEWSWGDTIFSQEEFIVAYFQGRTNLGNNEKTLMSSQIYLEGYNKNETPQKPILLSARNGEFFTESELLYQANIIQMDIKMNKDYRSEGVGIYRSGIKNGLPSYYIWGYYDLANNLRDYEKEGIDISNA